ncbi:hypothetical protein FRC02_005451 [Tulasnella sp. 418]|nr:hypothetical protein FRC02_005451 [Tulasnella sp. 418]
MFDNAGQHNTDKREGVEDTDPIVLQGVTNFEFESLLRVCEPMQFLGSGPMADFKEWSGVLHLCTMWCYDELREYAIQEIEKLKPAPVDSILLARKCNVDKWLKPAYIQLCNRTEPITADEEKDSSLPRHHTPPTHPQSFVARATTVIMHRGVIHVVDLACIIAEAVAGCSPKMTSTITAPILITPLTRSSKPMNS